MSEDIKNKSTEVAKVSVNVAAGATSINNLKSPDMVEEKVIATGVAKKEVANATAENVNAAEDAASINQNQNIMTDEKEKVAHTARIAIINGEEITIVVAHTKYGMELPKDKKNLCGSIDHNKMLSCIYHLATPEIFWEAGIELLDEGNSPIGKDTENVFVLCPTADTYWRVAVDDKLNRVEVHTFKSVAEYAQTIGCTNLYSRGLSNTEKMGVAALATGDEATMAVFNFAKKYEMPITTAQLYFDFKMKPTMLLTMTMGEKPENTPTLGRTTEEAEKLFGATELTFKKNALKRYAIRAMNVLLHTDNYNLDLMLQALEVIPSNEVALVEMAACEDRESCISSVLTKWLEALKNGDSQQKKAA